MSWAARTVGTVETNPGGTAVYSFTYSEAAATITHTAYLRTNRDSGDAEDELFELTIPAPIAEDRDGLGVTRHSQAEILLLLQ